MALDLLPQLDIPEKLKNSEGVEYSIEDVVPLEYANESFLRYINTERIERESDLQFVSRLQECLLSILDGLQFTDLYKNQINNILLGQMRHLGEDYEIVRFHNRLLAGYLSNIKPPYSSCVW